MAKEPVKNTVSENPPESMKIFESVTMLAPTPTGGFHPQEIYSGEGVSRTTAKKLRPREKRIRKIVTAEKTILDEYLQRHEKSSAKKKNGWAKDFFKNVTKSVKKGGKQVKLKDLF